ncbi:MAG: ribonuclease HI family protein [Candidatus Sumerlaeia bacterium]
MPAKPSANDIKKQFAELQKLLPEGPAAPEIIRLLANDADARQAILQKNPKLNSTDLQKFMNTMAGLFENIDAWADKSVSAPKAEKKETTPQATSGLADDPAAIARESQVKVFVDGAAKGNPGPASIGMVVTDIEGKTIYEDGQYIGEETNNVAEYTALITILKVLVANGKPKAFVFSDSALMVNQLNYQWKVKNPGIIPLFNEVQKLRRQLSGFQITHVRRENNKRADELANIAFRQYRDAYMR